MLYGPEKMSFVRYYGAFIFAIGSVGYVFSGSSEPKKDTQVQCSDVFYNGDDVIVLREASKHKLEYPEIVKE